MKRELHYAVVVDNKDYESEVLDGKKRGRLKVKCDTLLLNYDQNKSESAQNYEEKEYAIWCEPMFPFVGTNGSGWLFIPPVDSQVVIEVNINQLGFTQHIYWLCGVYSNVDEIPTELAENYPQRMGFKTPSGHVFFFDDSTGEINLIASDGRYIDMTPNGSIKLSTNNHKINMYSVNDSDISEDMIEIQSFDLASLIWLREKLINIEHGNSKIILNDKQVSISALSEIIVSAPVISISPQSSLAISVEQAGKIDINAPTSNIKVTGKVIDIESLEECSFGGKDFSAILAENLVAYNDAHVHTCATPGDPSGSPTVTMASLSGTPEDPVATKVKLKGNE